MWQECKYLSTLGSIIVTLYNPWKKSKIQTTINMRLRWQIWVSWQYHTLHHESHGKRESRISSRKTNHRRGEIQRGFFQRGSFLPLLFVIAIILLNYVPRKCRGPYIFTNSQEKINHLMFMDDMLLETLIQTIRITISQNIGTEFGLFKAKAVLAEGSPYIF